MYVIKNPPKVNDLAKIKFLKHNFGVIHFAA